MNYYRNNIRNVKGDTYSSTLLIENLGQDVDSIYFTCRDSLNDNSEILFEKKLNDGISLIEYDEEKDIRKYAVRIAPNDTNNLQTGTYYYDLQVSVNGDVFTIMKGFFIVEQDATRKYLPPVDPELYIKIILDEINGEVIGTTVTDKTDYLSDTKDLIKDSLNVLGADIDEEDTFRSYATSIDELYDEWPKTPITQGTSVTLENTKKGKMILNLNGNIEQDTFEGKNKLNITNSGETKNGVTYTKNEDGSVTLNGTATANTSFVISMQQITEPNTYSFGVTTDISSYGNQLEIGGYIYNSDNSFKYNLSTRPGRTPRTISNGEYITSFFIYLTAGQVFNNLTLYPQLEIGSTTSPFEKFVGGTASPNPDFPQDIRVVTGNNTIKVNTDNYPINLGNLELCKIGNYQDYLYKDGDDWYKHTEIKKVVLDGSEFWSYGGYTGVFYTTSITDYATSNNIPFSNYYKGVNNVTGASGMGAEDNNTIGFINISGGTTPRFYIKDTRYTNASDTPTLKSWLLTHNEPIYYAQATQTDTQITDTTLISQLNALKNAMSFDEETNVSSTYETGNAPFIISARALLKD